MRAGSYVIRATVGGHNVPGWPQPLHVEAGLSDAAQCWLTGPPLQVCTYQRLLHSICFEVPLVVCWMSLT